ncbi:MAG: SusC/RagA family TonB-linked outer membrane protein [Bacteroidetes bacterium]|nr:SusC/RagA family TonB-linked outer membrane protein [Bacteroidota bacterium]
MKKTKLLFHVTKWKTSSLLSFLAVMMISVCAYSQGAIKLKGKVIDENNAGLPGAAVSVKGTSDGTVSDGDGNFELSVQSDAVLVVTFIGYATQEVAVGGRTSIEIKMQTDATKLEEVVVIGYGVANKRDLTGSIVKLDGSVVSDKPNTDPVASLQGKVAGLSIVNNGTPGKSADVRIRGTVSIGNVHPLYVVDGILQDNIDYINPNDIASMEVLKDPSSLAIFGVRGATGVIMVATKKAKEGKTTVNFNSTVGIKELVNPIKMVDANGFKTLYTEENQNNGTTPYDLSTMTANTNWINAVTRVGVRQTNNLSISSSTEKNKFNVGLGYINDDGIIIHENLKKLTISLNDEAQLNKFLKVGFTFNTTRTTNPYTLNNPNNINPNTNRLDDARKVIPLVTALAKPFNVQDPYSTNQINQNIYSSLDVALQNSGVVNPVLEIENTWNKMSDIAYRNVGSFYTDVNFLKDFNFRATWYGDVSSQNFRLYSPLYYAYNPLDNTPFLYKNRTSVTEVDETIRKFQQDYLLNYKKSIGDHSLAATAGITSYYFGDFARMATVKQGSTASDLPIPNDPRFWYINTGFGAVDPTNTNSQQSEYSTLSFLGRVMYNYQGKYYLNASYRDDGTSRLTGKNRWQQFWALGAAWELTQEDFLQGLKDKIDFLKIKGSYGVLGNQTASQLDGTPINYPSYPNITTGSKAVFGNSIYNAYSSAYLANPNLKWETVNASEVGIELNAFQNRLHVEAAYFNRTTNDLMTYIDRSSLGLQNELINGGSLKNWGEEITAGWKQSITSDLRIDVGGNITFLKNKVVSLSPDLPNGFLSRAFMNNGSAESRTIVGQPIGSFYGYRVAGIFQSYADVLASPIQSSIGAYGPGDFKFQQINATDKTGGIVTASSRTVIGNPTPKFTYGMYVNVNYKQFSLSVDMQGVYGNVIFRTWGSLESPYQRVNYAQFMMDRWHGAGTSNWQPIISQGHRINYNGSTYNLEDGSYFRFRNVQLGYNLPASALSRMKLTALRLYVNCQNLLTIKHNQGYTPEYGGDATAFGYDNGGGAIPRVTTLGLNVTF